MNKEVDIVKELPAQKRYDYFIKKVVDYEAVWGLYNEGWATTEDSEGRKLVTFWPRSEFAEICAIGDWKGYMPARINLDEFLNNWMPGMMKDELKISVFWSNGNSVIVEPKRLLADMEEELENY